ncbi:hypothetical protein C0585_05470 [Candidatus Woesearchaeota archaeon]|nr:MAG: hypothetical protein C0585_05470 [Candidatus Woesearchaeota archaeon]
MVLGGGFEGMIRTLESYGVADVLLPFILIFTIVYAIMQKTQILGEGKKKFNVIIGFVLAMSVVIPHVLGTYPPNADVVDIINSALPSVSLVLVAVLALLLMMGIWGAKVNIAGKSLCGWVMIISIIFILIIFGSAANWFNLPDFLSFLNDPELQSLLIIVLVFGIIIAWITGDDDDKKDDGFFKKFVNAFSESTGKD